MLKIIQRFNPDTAIKPIEVIDRLSLPLDLRKRGRFRATTDSGLEVGIFIERGQVLEQGDLLLTACDQLIQVVAQPEPVVTASTDDWHAFARVCYHLGNRHVPLQVGERWLRFQPDHVLQQLAEHYGLTTQSEQAPFCPENGAYGRFGGHSHAHSHDHDEGHDPHNPNHDHLHVHGH